MTVCLLALPVAAQAWNAAGHRLIAVIAWRQLSPATQTFVAEALARHPDYPRWAERTHGSDGALFAEAATWPDDIRDDPRFFDETREPATPALLDLADTARHKRWHYVDFDAEGKIAEGEIDRQIGRLADLLRSTGKKAEISYALPWLIHLVGDIHMPLHVGRSSDEGGNTVVIENPANPRQSLTRLHTYWDDLPGPPWLRGQRLNERAAALIEKHAPPEQGTFRLWRDESHRLLAAAYPPENGRQPPLADQAFRLRSQEIADRRLSEAGYRLARLLEENIAGRAARAAK